MISILVYKEWVCYKYIINMLSMKNRHVINVLYMKIEYIVYVLYMKISGEQRVPSYRSPLLKLKNDRPPIKN